MRAAVFVEPRRIEVADRPDAAIREPTDAIVRVALACVCGSDLWFYRGESPFEPGPIGHEFIGVVEDVGAEVHKVKKGDFVISPFAFSDGTCAHCRHGITTACVHGGFFPNGNGDGGQGEAVRVPLADGTLVQVPGSGHSDEAMASFLTLSDVMGTGEHAAVCIALSRHADRQRLAREFGAADIVAARGEEAIAAVLELTEGVGVDATLECVGTGQAMDTALGITRPGSVIGYVGVPHGSEFPVQAMFYRNKGVQGGPAPARHYLPELLDDVLEGRINPGRVLDFQTDLDGVAEAYAAMDERRAIKSLLRVGAV